MAATELFEYGVDARLRDISLRFHNPETSIENLNRGHPDPNRTVEVIGYYDETPPGGRKANPNIPYVWCCHCGKATHWKGYVIRDSENEVFIIGAKNCGRDHYGVQFEEAERAFGQLVARKRALQRWDLVQNQVPIAAARMEAALHSDELRQIDAIRQAFKAASADCFRELVRHIKSRTPLRRRLSERDYDAEEKRRQRYDRALITFNSLPPEERRRRRLEGLEPVEDTDPIFREWMEEYGLIQGGLFLIEEDDLRSRLLDVRRAIKSCEAVISNGTSTIQTTMLTKLVADFRKALEAVFTAHANLAFDNLFFSQGNIDRLARWAEGFEHFGIEEAETGAIIITDRAGRRTSISAFDPPAFPVADDLNAIAREIELIVV